LARFPLDNASGVPRDPAFSAQHEKIPLDRRKPSTFLRHFLPVFLKSARAVKLSIDHGAASLEVFTKLVA
jgi:hypothetical protein